MTITHLHNVNLQTIHVYVIKSSKFVTIYDPQNWLIRVKGQ